MTHINDNWPEVEMPDGSNDDKIYQDGFKAGYNKRLQEETKEQETMMDKMHAEHSQVEDLEGNPDGREFNDEQEDKI